MKSNCLINEVPRRSLRRATIERRVWAEPHKGKNVKFKKQKTKKCRLSLYQKLKPSSSNHNKVINAGKKGKIYAGECRDIETESSNVIKRQKLITFNSTKDVDRPISNAIEKYTKIGSHSIHARLQKRKNASKFCNENTLSTVLHNCTPMTNSINKEISKDLISLIDYEKNVNNCPSTEYFSENQGCRIDNNKSIKSNQIIKSSIVDDDKECTDKNLTNNSVLTKEKIIHVDKSDFTDAGPSKLQSFPLKFENEIEDNCKTLSICPSKNTLFCDDNDNCLLSRKRLKIGKILSDDNHVSLKEALAKLVDSDQSGQGTEGETVTIHPVTNADSSDENETLLKREKIVSSCCPQIFLEKNIFPGKQSPLPKFENRVKITNVHDEDQQKCEEEVYKQNCHSNVKLALLADENSAENSFLASFNKEQPPTLIKVPNKTPVVKTPLKCSECPMRFCTVRSLLWHFGTHEPKRKDKAPGSVLLENLVASWDNPHLILNNCLENAEINLMKGSQTSFFSSTVKESFEDDKLFMEMGNNPSVNGDFILKVPIPKLIHRKKCNSLLSYSKDDEDGDCLLDVCTSKVDTNNCNLINSHSNIANYSSSSAPCSCNSKLLSISHTSSNGITKSFQNLTSTFHENKDTKSSRHISSCTYSNLDANSELDSFCELPTLPICAIPRSPSTSPKLPLEHCFSKPDINNSIQVNLPDVRINPKHSVTVIPVECLGHMRQQMELPSTITNCASETCESDSRLFEKDGLVMINKNLAIRIMATDGEAKDSKSFQRYSSSLTIYPQSKNFELESKSKGYKTIPDILTIVPQTDHAKSSLENSSTSSPQLITAMGKVTPDLSHVVKLVLIPSKDKQMKSLLNQEFSLKHDCNSSKVNQYTANQLQTPFSQGSSDSYSENDYDSDDESEEGGMVIDVKEDGEESSMDPLSLCSVTMEEETPINVSIASQTNSVSSASSDCATNSNYKSPNETSKKHPIKEDDEKYQRRKYVCQYCQKRFGWSTDLKRHVILHTGERPFKCKWCPITFTRKFLLQNHMKKIHAQVCKWSDLWE